MGMYMFLPQRHSLLICSFLVSFWNLYILLPLAQVLFILDVCDNCSFILPALFSSHSLVFFVCLCSHPHLSVHPNKAHLCLTHSAFPWPIKADFSFPSWLSCFHLSDSTVLFVCLFVCSLFHVPSSFTRTFSLVWWSLLWDWFTVYFWLHWQKL